MHVITGLGAGGAEAMLCQLAGALQAKGWPQHVVSLKDGGVHGEALADAGVEVRALGISSAVSAPLPLARLVRLVRERRPGILQGWMYHGNLAASLAHRLAPGRTGRRLFWNLRASNMDAARYARIIGWNARFSGQPDIVIANSGAGRDFHLEQGFHPRRMEVVHNGIDTDAFRPDGAVRKAVRAELGIAPDAIVALHSARVDPMKDHATFLAAMAACPSITGLMAGLDTESLPRPGNVRALGLRRDMARICQAANMIVSSSAFGEGFSNVTGEGMASGLVPVATDVGDARIIVGDTGRVVAPGDSDALATAISGEAAGGADGLRKKGLRARQRILDNFALKNAVESFARLYSDPHGQ